MRLSALDIKKQEFTKTLRGLDAEEVHAFLTELARQWEEMQGDFRRTEDRVRELENKLEHYQRVEEALQEALQTARESSKQALENAKQEASLIVRKAMGEAEDLTRNASARRDALHQEIDNLQKRRDEIVARLRAFLNAEVEMLARYRDHEMLAVGRSAAGEEQPAEDPTWATGSAVVRGLDPVVLDPEEPTAHLPDLEVQVSETADVAGDQPEEMPFDLEGLDAVLREMGEQEAVAFEGPVEALEAVRSGDFVEEADWEEPSAQPSEPERPAAAASETLEADEIRQAPVEEDIASSAAEDAPVALVIDDAPDFYEEAAAGADQAEASAWEASSTDVVIPEEEAFPDDEGPMEDPVAEPPVQEAAEDTPEPAPEGEEEAPLAGAPEQGEAPEDDESIQFFSAEEPLTFRFFEPNEEPDEMQFYEDRPAPRFGPDQQPKRPPSYGFEEDFTSGETWIVRPSEPSRQTPENAPSVEEGLAASSEEIEKIKRILSDLD